jgi:glycosyltransferase involved in cell wall biosynthesis
MTWSIFMKVLIDCTQIARKKAGVGVYGLNLIKGMCERRHGDLELWLLVQSDDPDFFFEKDGVHSVCVPSRLFRYLPFRFFLEQVYIPWFLQRHKIDVLHSLHYSFPLCKTRARKIVTIHDLTFFIMPEVHLPVKLAYFRFFIRAASRHADALIFISTSTKTDWRRYFPKSSKPSFVIPHGKAPTYRPDIDPCEIDRTTLKHGITQPYILYIGTIEPRKNLPRLVAAFAQLAESFPAHKLVIAGMKGWMYADLYEKVKSFHLQSRVVFTGFVPEEDKPGLLAGAEVFVYPSLYEGFGIPVDDYASCSGEDKAIV